MEFRTARRVRIPGGSDLSDVCALGLHPTLPVLHFAVHSAIYQTILDEDLVSNASAPTRLILRCPSRATHLLYAAPHLLVICCADGSILVYHLHQSCLLAVHRPKAKNERSPIVACCVSGFGRTLFFTRQKYTTGEFSAFDVVTGVHHKLHGHRKPVCGIAFHTQQRILASVAVDGSVIIWDHRAGTPLLTLDTTAAIQLKSESASGASAQVTSTPTSICFHPRDRILYVGHSDGSINVWDVRPNSFKQGQENLRMVQSLLTARKYPVRCLMTHGQLPFLFTLLGTSEVRAYLCTLVGQRALHPTRAVEPYTPYYSAGQGQAFRSIDLRVLSSMIYMSSFDRQPYLAVLPSVSRSGSARRLRSDVTSYFPVYQLTDTDSPSLLTNSIIMSVLPPYDLKESTPKGAVTDLFDEKPAAVGFGTDFGTNFEDDFLSGKAEGVAEGVTPGKSTSTAAPAVDNAAGWMMIDGYKIRFCTEAEGELKDMFVLANGMPSFTRAIKTAKGQTTQTLYVRPLRLVENAVDNGKKVFLVVFELFLQRGGQSSNAMGSHNSSGRQRIWTIYCDDHPKGMDFVEGDDAVALPNGRFVVLQKRGTDTFLKCIDANQVLTSSGGLPEYVRQVPSSSMIVVGMSVAALHCPYLPVQEPSTSMLRGSELGIRLFPAPSGDGVLVLTSVCTPIGGSQNGSSCANMQPYTYSYRLRYALLEGAEFKGFTSATGQSEAYFSFRDGEHVLDVVWNRPTALSCGMPLKNTLAAVVTSERVVILNDLLVHVNSISPPNTHPLSSIQSIPLSSVGSTPAYELAMQSSAVNGGSCRSVFWLTPRVLLFVCGKYLYYYCLALRVPQRLISLSTTTDTVIGCDEQSIVVVTRRHALDTHMHHQTVVRRPCGFLEPLIMDTLSAIKDGGIASGSRTPSPTKLIFETPSLNRVNDAKVLETVLALMERCDSIRVSPTLLLTLVEFERADVAYVLSHHPQSSISWPLRFKLAVAVHEFESALELFTGGVQMPFVPHLDSFCRLREDVAALGALLVNTYVSSRTGEELPVADAYEKDPVLHTVLNILWEVEMLDEATSVAYSLLSDRATVYTKQWITDHFDRHPVADIDNGEPISPKEKTRRTHLRSVLLEGLRVSETVDLTSKVTCSLPQELRKFMPADEAETDGGAFRLGEKAKEVVVYGDVGIEFMNGWLQSTPQLGPQRHVALGRGFEYQLDQGSGLTLAPKLNTAASLIAGGGRHRGVSFAAEQSRPSLESTASESTTRSIDDTFGESPVKQPVKAAKKPTGGTSPPRHEDADETASVDSNTDVKSDTGDNDEKPDADATEVDKEGFTVRDNAEDDRKKYMSAYMDDDDGFYSDEDEEDELDDVPGSFRGIKVVIEKEAIVTEADEQSLAAAIGSLQLGAFFSGGSEASRRSSVTSATTDRTAVSDSDSDNDGPVASPVQQSEHDESAVKDSGFDVAFDDDFGGSGDAFEAPHEEESAAPSSPSPATGNEKDSPSNSPAQEVSQKPVQAKNVPVLSSSLADIMSGGEPPKASEPIAANEDFGFDDAFAGEAPDSKPADDTAVAQEAPVATPEPTPEDPSNAAFDAGFDDSFGGDFDDPVEPPKEADEHSHDPVGPSSTGESSHTSTDDNAEETRADSGTEVAPETLPEPDPVREPEVERGTVAGAELDGNDAVAAGIDEPRESDGTDEQGPVDTPDDETECSQAAKDEDAADVPPEPQGFDSAFDDDFGSAHVAETDSVPVVVEADQPADKASSPVSPAKSPPDERHVPSVTIRFNDLLPKETEGGDTPTMEAGDNNSPDAASPPESAEEGGEETELQFDDAFGDSLEPPNPEAGDIDSGRQPGSDADLDSEDTPAPEAIVDPVDDGAAHFDAGFDDDFGAVPSEGDDLHAGDVGATVPDTSSGVTETTGDTAIEKSPDVSDNAGVASSAFFDDSEDEDDVMGDQHKECVDNGNASLRQCVSEWDQGRIAEALEAAVMAMQCFTASPNLDLIKKEIGLTARYRIVLTVLLKIQALEREKRSIADPNSEQLQGIRRRLLFYALVIASTELPAPNGAVCKQMAIRRLMSGSQFGTAAAIIKAWLATASADYSRELNSLLEECRAEDFKNVDPPYGDLHDRYPVRFCSKTFEWIPDDMLATAADVCPVCSSSYLLSSVDIDELCAFCEVGTLSPSR